MKYSIYSLILSAFTFLSCDRPEPGNNTSSTSETAEQLPYFNYHAANLFPGDSSLLRPEDGVGLADGRIIVVDQAKGLRIIEAGGSHRPFGNFAAVGFVHNPPQTVAGPNGVFLEHDKQHLLLCDVANGKIFRIDIATEQVALVYDHPYGVNAVYRDRTGAIWFSQSAKNTNMEDLFMALNLPLPTGAVFRMADLKSAPVKVVDSLYFANGITMDLGEKTLFVAETMLNRVQSFKIDRASGKVSNAELVATIGAPDNMLVDTKGRLFIASPGTNKVIAVDFKNHSQQVIFDASTNESRKIANEWYRRSELGLERAALITPVLHYPLSGLLTGVFFSQDGRALYVTNLGTDILKFNFK